MTSAIIFRKIFCKFIQTLGGVMKLLFILLLGLGFTQEDSSKHPYGKNTENWYTLWGMGPSFTNNYCTEYLNDAYNCSDNSYSIAGEGFGLYKHINANGIIGVVLTSKYDSWTKNETGIDIHGNSYPSSSHWNYHQYLYSLSYLNYIATFGKGPYLRFDFGAAKKYLNIFTSDEDYMGKADWGFGTSLGIGYSFDFTKTRILIGLYSTANFFKDKNDSYLNLLISGLF